MAQTLKGIEVFPLDDDLGRRAGLLLASTATGDVVDAALVACADGDRIITSDLDDLRVLADASDSRLELVAVGR
jgi:hypothetical protein